MTSCADSPNRPGLTLLWRTPSGVRVTSRPVTCDRWDCSECGPFKMQGHVRSLLRIVQPSQQVFTARVPVDRIETVRKAQRLRGGGRVTVALKDGQAVVVADVDVLTQQRVRKGTRWTVSALSAAEVGQALRDPVLVQRVKRVDWGGTWRGRNAPPRPVGGGELLATAWFGLGHAERQLFCRRYGYDVHVLTVGGELPWDPDGQQVRQFEADLAEWRRTVRVPRPRP